MDILQSLGVAGRPSKKRGGTPAATSSAPARKKGKTTTRTEASVSAAKALPLNEGILAGVIKDMVALLSPSELTALKAHCKEEARTATVCSGTDFICRIWNQIRYLVDPSNEHIRCLWTCEKEGWKQGFIKEFHEFQGLPAPKIFSDLVQLPDGCHRGMPDFVQNGNLSDVDAVDYVIGGTSCKDLSSLKKNKEYLSTTSLGSGTTGATIEGLLRFMEYRRPKVILGEQVSGLLRSEASGDEDTKHMPFFMQTLQSIQHTPQWLCINSKPAGFPQNRLRVIWIAVSNDLPAAGKVADSWRNICLRLTEEGTIKMRPLRDFILPIDHADVKEAAAKAAQHFKTRDKSHIDLQDVMWRKDGAFDEESSPSSSDATSSADSNEHDDDNDDEAEEEKQVGKESDRLDQGDDPSRPADDDGEEEEEWDCEVLAKLKSELRWVDKVKPEDIDYKPGYKWISYHLQVSRDHDFEFRRILPRLHAQSVGRCKFTKSLAKLEDESPCYRTLTDREKHLLYLQEILDACLTKQSHDCSSAEMALTNVSQNAGRATSLSGVSPCVTPTGRYWVHCQVTSASRLNDLAGNAFNGGVMAAALIALCCSLSLHKS